jgi:Skp family chaperone for outer membrane proteins
MSGFKITHPMRFFGFFGLFLVFLFLAVKSCTDKPSDVAFVDVEDVSNPRVPKDKENSDDLNDLIEDVKKDIKEQEELEKKLSKKDLEVLEDKNLDRKKAQDIKKRAATAKTPVKKEPTPKKEPAAKAASKYSGASVLVKSFDGLDAYAKMQLKKNVASINKVGKGKVTIYGTYLPGEAKPKGFVRAAKVKNELIKLGLKGSISVFMLPEQRSKRDASARVVFK